MLSRNIPKLIGAVAVSSISVHAIYRAKSSVVSIQVPAERGFSIAPACVVSFCDADRNDKSRESSAARTGILASVSSWLFKAQNETDDARSQYSLGVRYMLDNGAASNKEEAVRHFKLAADQGLSAAEFALGVCYWHGDGTPQDRVQAVVYFQRAADQGNADAQCTMGELYRTDVGVATDLNRAVEFYQLAADQGNAGALCGLGICYRDGAGVEQDHKVAMWYLRRAADQGDLQAQYYLAYMLYDLNDDDNDEHYWHDIMKYLKLAADQGHVPSAFLLWVRHIYEDKSGANVNTFHYMQFAAKHGSILSQTYVGGYLWSGYDDVVQDKEEGLRLLRLSAEQGCAVAAGALTHLDDLTAWTDTQEYKDLLEQAITANLTAIEADTDFWELH